MKKLVSDTLTREKIDQSVKRFAERYCRNRAVYDIGGVARYDYSKYFSKYYTINFDKNEKPDIVADAEELPLPSGTIRAALCVALLEHVNDPGKVLDQIHRVLANKGYLYLWVPFYWREHNYPIDNLRFTHQGIKSLLKKHNFAVISSDSNSYGGLFFVLSHGLRFMMKDPHRCSSYNPLLYIHALLSIMSRADNLFKLKYPNVYTGTAVIARKI